MSIYLDYNASAPIDPRVLETMVDVYKNDVGNPDSRTHDYGNHARQIVEKSRASVASLLKVNPDEVFFTSGATESNNIVIQGLQHYGEKTNRKHIITTTIEHKAILETVKVMEGRGFNAEYINPDSTGKINVEHLLSKVRKDTLLVSVMHVNNETGIIQPVYEIGDKLLGTDVLFHVDATQSCGKLVDEVRNLKYNSLAFSAHKLRGPQGIGALILRKNNYKLPPIEPIMFGGGQEHGICPGTVPVALVAGLGKACEIAEKEYQSNEIAVSNIKKEILQLLVKSGLKYHIIGDQNCCISSTLCLSIDGVNSEALMLSSKKYCGISNGSACSSNSYKPSYVLSSMGLPNDQIADSIRISWGPDVQQKELSDNFTEFIKIAKSLQ